MTPLWLRSRRRNRLNSTLTSCLDPALSQASNETACQQNRAAKFHANLSPGLSTQTARDDDIAQGKNAQGVLFCRSATSSGRSPSEMLAPIVVVVH